MTKTQALRLVSFAVLALAMIYGMGQLFRDKDTTLAGFYSEPKQTMDVIAVGSSHVNSAVIPAVLWREAGANAHNIYSWSQPMWISYYYIKEALRFQTPRAVVLDLYGMMYGNSDEQPTEIDKVNYRNSFSIDTSPVFWEMTRTVANCGIDLRNPVDFLNPIRYHTAWKNLTKHNFATNPHDAYSFLKGFGIQNGHHVGVKQDFSVPATPRAPYDTAVKYLEKIVELSRKKGFTLIFTMLPYEYRADERELFAWLADYAERNEILFLNYCEEDGKRIGFDYATHFNDPGHVNYTGAQVLSSDLAAVLTQQCGPFSPDTLPNKIQLNEDAEKMYRVLEVNDAIDKDVSAYFEYLVSDTNLVVYANFAANATAPPALANAVQALGLDTTNAGITSIDGKKRDTSDKMMEQAGLRLTNRNGKPQTAYQEKVYLDTNIPYQFCVYDKVLERPTFYFYFDAASGQLVIGDFPANA